MKTTRNEVLELCRQGKGTNEIAKLLGVSAASVSYHKGKIKLEVEEDYITPSRGVYKQLNTTEWAEIQDTIDSGVGHHAICDAHGISRGTLTSAYKKGLVVRPKRVCEKSLVEYLEDWCGREATANFRKTTKKKLVQEGHCPLSCSICGLTEWRGQPAPLELDHIDGDPTNNKFDNFRIICLHCHTQTDTFGWRNKKAREKLGRG